MTRTGRAVAVDSDTSKDWDRPFADWQVLDVMAGLADVGRGQTASGLIPTFGTLVFGRR